MLILTRRTNETFYIGDGPGRIAVTVVSVRGRTVRVGIDAPRDVLVDRAEIRKRREQEEAEEC
jgi:carbon storage regulator